MQARLPIDYTDIFRGSVVIIVGAGRSGTTILGKLLGSMAPVYYLFEPTILRTIRSHDHLATLFEDYFLPIIQGRQKNDDPAHRTYGDFYWATSKKIRNQKKRTLKSRVDAFHHIKSEKPLFVMKMVDAQVLKPVYSELFEGVKYLHIVRNGLDVIKSAIAHGWYTSKYYTLQNDYVVPHGICNIPWWVEKDVAEMWPGWSPITRAAYNWRFLVQLLPKSLHYESLAANPLKIVKFLEETFGLERTDLTDKHVEQIMCYMPSKYDTIRLDMIEEPERGRFKDIMDKLGYRT